MSLAGLWMLERKRLLEYFPAASRLSPASRNGLDSLLAGRKSATFRMDSTLGWRTSVEITPQGIRDDRQYSPEPDSGSLRISAFGDSFTHGSDVPLDASWAKRISAIRPSIEVLNYGVDAYGLDQAYIRYLGEGTDLDPDIVLIGYMSENLARHVNVFRGFYTPWYRDFFFSKPRFKVEGGELRLLPNPLRTIADYQRLRDDPERILGELGTNDFHFVGQNRAGPFDFSPTVRIGKLVAGRIQRARQRQILTPDGRYDTRSEAYEVTLRILDAFYRDVIGNGAVPIIVVFPDLDDLKRARAGKVRRYAPILEYFDSRGYRYIDILNAFEPVDSGRRLYSLVVLPGGHYSKLGNDLAARYMLKRLEEWSLDQTP